MTRTVVQNVKSNLRIRTWMSSNKGIFYGAVCWKIEFHGAGKYPVDSQSACVQGKNSSTTFFSEIGVY